MLFLLTFIKEYKKMKDFWHKLQIMQQRIYINAKLERDVWVEPTTPETETTDGLCLLEAMHFQGELNLTECNEHFFTGWWYGISK